ncbi:unnamed protein product [Urochloa decumbens]|uniref:Uncharacterized protein n=1 Tax=Urochloa decumbens TaxID=240449 RepID=A0ABC8VLF9_9POAL
MGTLGRSLGEAGYLDQLVAVASDSSSPHQPAFAARTMSSPVNSNNNGKAMVKEEVSSPTAMDDVVPHTMFQPPVTQENNYNANHQAPPLLNKSVTDDDKSKVAGWSSSSMTPSSSVPEPLVWTPALLVRDLMKHCVAALDAGNLAEVNTDLRLMSFFSLASPTGNPTQRVAFAFAEALARRAIQATLPGLSWALGLQVAQQPAAAPYAADAARRCFDSLCPFLRVAASAANQAIVPAATSAGKKQVHVVDLGGASTDQWLALLRLFAAVRRAGAAPFLLRLSVVTLQEASLSRAAGVLTQEAVRLRVPFVFNPVRSYIDRFSPADIAALGARPRGGEEVLVITSTLQLHRLLASEVSVELSPRAGPSRQVITRADVLLRVLCDMSPELVLLTEQEAEHNGTGLSDRVSSAFDYYAALFGDLVAAGGGESAERAAVERVLLREEIVDIVAREGSARRERHEGVRSWAKRMAAAGFEPATAVMSYDASAAAAADVGLQAQQMAAADGTLRYWVRNEDACVVVYSRMTPIFSVTAWRPAGELKKNNGK